VSLVVYTDSANQYRLNNLIGEKKAVTTVASKRRCRQVFNRRQLGQMPVEKHLESFY